MTKTSYFYKGYGHIPSECARQMWFFVHAVGWFACAPEYDVARTSFFGYQIKYVLRGKGYVEWEGRIYPVCAGEVFLLDLSQAHRYYADVQEPWEVLWVHFDGVGCSAWYSLLSAGDNPVFAVADPDEVESQCRQLVRLFRKRPVGMEALASSAITRILTQIAVAREASGVPAREPQAPPYPDGIRHGIAYIEAHYSETLSLEDIATHATLSPFHFARLFKRTTGQSVMEYLLRTRLHMARHLLTQTALPVHEVAEKCGFADPSYFSRTFKRFEGHTPSAYRRQVAQG